MRKIIAGLVVVVSLFAGGSHVYEAAYCRGVAQGALDSLSMVFGNPPQELGQVIHQEVVASCQKLTLDRGWAPRTSAYLNDYSNANWFDKVTEPVVSRVALGWNIISREVKELFS